ncbi:MAG: translocation/assembly module TamB, partial [Alphaproteobacteria bacterium]|nr:translocation/assembly module TamB [Alphaproteobacteria bacterium]
DGPLRNLKYGIQLSGSLRDRELRLAANGELVAAGERISVSVATLAGKLAGVPIRLRKPALVAASPVIDSGDIDLAVGGGVILGRFRQGDDVVSARMEVDAIPLMSVWPDAPPLFDQAVVDAAASLDGPAARPGGRLDLSVTRLAADEAAESPEGVSLRLQGDLRNGRLAASGRVEGLAGVTSRAQLGLPVHLSLAPAAISIDGQAPLDGSVTYDGPIAPGWALLGLDRHRLEGQGDIALEFSGKYDDPRISGQVEISDGRYENLDTGTILSEILVSARPSDSALIIDKAVARDGGEGEVSVSGGVDFGGGDLVDMDLRASLRKARLVRRDELNAVVSGQLALRGNAARREISGKLEVEEAEIMLAGGLPASVVDIQVEEIGTPSAGGVKAPMPVRPSRTDLDLAIAMPKRVFVRGRGLDSEWGGALTVTGTASSPRIQGQLTPLRGRYDFAGKIFNLREGSIAFAGKDEIDPQLDLSAEREATDLTAIIHVTGTARKPVVTLESIPQYPRDEVLARVLFNKSTGRLSAAEALQLAQAVGTLTGVSDGGGIMDFARGMLNLDVLRFGEAGAEGPGGAEAGKYINDRVYIGVEGNAAGESGVTVEIEITPRLKLESDVGAESKSQMGLKWKRDY